MTLSARAWRIWKMPLLLGLCSLAGLIAALLVEGGGDVLWTAFAAVPLAVIIAQVRRRADAR